MGRAIRDPYDDPERIKIRETWVCQLCGENTYDVDLDYIGSNTNHLGCEMKGGSGSIGWLGMEWPKDRDIHER